MVAVNPAAQEVEGQPCYAHLRQITPPVENVLLMTAPDITRDVVEECANAGVKRVWMYRAGGQGLSTLKQ